MPPLPPNGQYDLTAVWSDGGETVLALGAGLMRWSRAADGTDRWSVVPQADDSGRPLFGSGGLWGTSGNDVWAVANGIFHYDGSLVTEVRLDDGGFVPWYAIDGSGPNNVWAVGGEGSVAHFDGIRWTRSTSAANYHDLRSVWVDPKTGDAWACGNVGVVQRYTPGGGWQRVPSPVFDITAIWGTSATDVWIAGQGRFYRFNGTTFNVMPSPTKAPLFNASRIQALRGDGSGGVLAISQLGLVMRWNGNTWDWEPTKTDAELSGLWLGSDGRGWAVGEGGTILRRR